MMDGNGRVNWVHLQAIHHVMSMHVVPAEQEQESGSGSEASVLMIFPMSLRDCQSIIPHHHLDLDHEQDRARVAGLWVCSFCFYDLIFTTTQTCLMTIRFNDVFRCLPLVFRTVNVKLRVIGTQPEPDRPGRPIIAIAGEVNDMATIVGWIRVMSDNQIQWHFNSGGHGDAIWSFGVQVGGIRSTFGVLGIWTTTPHDVIPRIFVAQHKHEHFPLGPFWMREVHSPSEVEDMDQPTSLFLLQCAYYMLIHALDLLRVL
ncbi:hypothetical protein BKA93DRAFT_543566 [Sparassis latifolia]